MGVKAFLYTLKFIQCRSKQNIGKKIEKEDINLQEKVSKDRMITNLFM
jgi:hypothetical protein